MTNKLFLGSDLADSANDFARLANRIDNVETKVDAIQETLTAILTKFTDLSTEIRPTLDALTNHPLIKMLSKGKP